MKTIAYQGHPGAYSHLACQHVFADQPTVAANTFREAMAWVEQGKADLAMIPVENSTAGRVEEIYRLIPQMQLHIVGEHFEPVNHCLMAIPGTTLAQLHTVSSHPQALAQCLGHIDALHLKTVATLDTAGAALEVKEAGDPHRAAIASSLAADIYGLDILRDNFQDVTGNTTRFIILSHSESLPAFDAEQNYITSLLFRVRNIPASLYKALGGFATNGINLIKLESYTPGGKMNASQFHADMQGHLDMPAMQRALEELRFFADDIRVLGTYLSHPFRRDKAFHD